MLGSPHPWNKKKKKINGEKKETGAMISILDSFCKLLRKTPSIFFISSRREAGGGLGALAAPQEYQQQEKSSQLSLPMSS